MINEILLIIGGLVFLIGGAECLVRGAAGLALRLGIPAIVVGLTVVALGTSAPELVVGVKSSLSGSGELALGAVVGSNICNLLLILAFAALISPLKIQRDALRIDVPIMAGAALILCALLFATGGISRLAGAGLTLGILAYILFSLWRASRPDDTPQEQPGAPEPENEKLSFLLLLVVFGLVQLKFGGDLLVDNAVLLAERLGMSKALIGLTIVAIGSSLPELATAITAARKNQGDLIVGNVIGSNIFNTLCILGIAALVAPIPFQGIGWFELTFMLIASLGVIPLLRSGYLLSRWEGLIMLAGYLIYLFLVISRATGVGIS